MKARENILFLLHPSAFFLDRCRMLWMSQAPSNSMAVTTTDYCIRRSCFTLLELLVVTSLMAVAVSAVVVRMDGLTDHGRLRSAAVQIGSLLNLTQVQARTGGMPRLLEYLAETDRVTVRSPRRNDGRWEWSDPIEYRTATGVRIISVLVEGEDPAEIDGTARAIRVGADGRCRSYAVILELHGLYAIVVHRGTEEPHYTFVDREPQAESFELLAVELCQIHEQE